VPVRVLIDVVAASRVVPVRWSSAHTPAAPALPAWPASTAPNGDRVPLNQRALPTLGRLAREHRVELCTYAEIAGATPGGWPAGTVLDLLGEVVLSSVDAALDRAAIDADVFRDHAQPGALLRFCTRLKAGHRALEHLSPEYVAELPDATRRGVAALDRFCELAARTRGDHLVDLFHLWTGELAGCSYLLTFDAQLASFLETHVHTTLSRPLSCNPIEPDALLALLGVEERDPPPALAGNVVDLFGRRYQRARDEAP
jgi:hypothetical protein